MLELVAAYLYSLARYLCYNTMPQLFSELIKSMRTLQNRYCQSGNTYYIYIYGLAVDSKYSGALVHLSHTDLTVYSSFCSTNHYSTGFYIRSNPGIEVYITIRWSFLGTLANISSRRPQTALFSSSALSSVGVYTYNTATHPFFTFNLTFNSLLLTPFYSSLHYLRFPEVITAILPFALLFIVPKYTPTP